MAEPAPRVERRQVIFMEKQSCRQDKTKSCKRCPAYKKCRDTAASWFFFFTGLLATIAIRAVNIFLDTSPLWAKISWYIGIVGFLLYFLYKFNQDRGLQKNIEKIQLSEKLLARASLSPADYEFLTLVVCKLKSKKDAINYFFIFFTSVLALLLGIYQDFLR